LTTAYRARLEALAREGRALEDRLTADPTSSAALDQARSWQHQCGALVGELSGGTKTHWLARAFSGAHLIPGGHTSAPIAEILARIIGVLDQAERSLGELDRNAAAGHEREPSLRPPSGRFEFVSDAALRPVLDAAYVESREALDDSRFTDALRMSCGLLEAIVTDVLARVERSHLDVHGAPRTAVTEWPFEVRLAVAERAGVIRGGCARLPPAARRYRDPATVAEGLSEEAVSEHDARVTGQVLRVVMRDLNPGR
jgi:hypothetical protein